MHQKRSKYIAKQMGFDAIKRNLFVCLLAVNLLVLVGCSSRFQVGYEALQSERYNEAATIFRDLAQRPGQSMAKNNLGYMYENGLGVEKSIGKAAFWYEQAVADDPSNAVAQANLGTILLYGYGTARDLPRAFQSFQIAANQGDRRAQYFLATMYQKGLGVSQNLGQAINLYRAAANQGLDEARQRLARITSEDYRQQQLRIQNTERALRGLDARLVYSGFYDYSSNCSKRNNWSCDERLGLTSIFGEVNGKLIGYYEIRNPDSSITKGVYDLPDRLSETNQLVLSWGDEFGRGAIQLKTSDRWNNFEGIWSFEEARGVMRPVGRWTGTAQRGKTLAALIPNKSPLPAAKRPDLSLRQSEFISALEQELRPESHAISRDDAPPVLQLNYEQSSNVRGIVRGRATDRSGIAELRVDGKLVAIDQAGNFEYSTYVPLGGKQVSVTATDYAGLSTTEMILMSRVEEDVVRPRLAAANPLNGPKQAIKRNRAALIIGVERYVVTPSAEFAARDAHVFADYAREKLGVPAENVTVLTDADASMRGILRALKVWLPQVVVPDETDLYVFYAGHGMPTADGSSAYIVPHDGDLQLLEDTAISRSRFFSEIQDAQPRSATFFFDNCYSGATRSEERLLATRPLGIKVKQTEIPENYLVFTAGEANQTAGVLDEVQHGRFSYFVFRGLEGEADRNQDGKISASELHGYVRESVGRFSAGAQTPTLVGNGARWILQ